MNWQKSKSKTVLLSILYGCIIPIFIFCLVYATQRLATGPVETEITRESGLPGMLYGLRPAVVCFSVLMIVAFTLVFYKDYVVRYVDSEIKAKRAIWLANVSFGIVVLTSIVYTALAALSLIGIGAAQTDALRGSLRIDFVWQTGIALLGIICLSDEIKSRRYFRRKSIPAILADYHFRRHKEAMSDNNIDEAHKALVRACEAAPAEVVPWATRAAFTAEFLSSPEDAEKYLERAAENLRKHPEISDEDKAWYEFYVGRIMLSKGELEEGTAHIERSVKLHHHSGRANFLRKLQREHNFKIGISEDEQKQ